LKEKWETQAQQLGQLQLCAISLIVEQLTASAIEERISWVNGQNVQMVQMGQWFAKEVLHQISWLPRCYDKTS